MPRLLSRRSSASSDSSNSLARPTPSAEVQISKFPPDLSFPRYTHAINAQLAATFRPRPNDASQRERVERNLEARQKVQLEYAQGETEADLTYGPQRSACSAASGQRRPLAKPKILDRRRATRLRSGARWTASLWRIGRAAVNGRIFDRVEWIHWAERQESREEQVRHRRIFSARPWIRSTTPHPRPALAQRIDIPVSWQRDRTFIFSSVVRHVILPVLRWTTRSCFASNVNLLLCSLRYHSTTTTDTKAGTPHNASGCHPRRHAGRLRPVRRLRRPTFAQ